MSTKVHLHGSYATFISFSIAIAAWNSNAEEKCPKLLLWELLVFLDSCAEFCTLPSSLCKMTSASEYFLLISIILVMRLPLCCQEVWSLEKVRFKFQKGLGLSFCCEQPEGSVLTFLDPHPAPGTSKSLLAQHVVPAKGEAYQTESQAASSNPLHIGASALLFLGFCPIIQIPPSHHITPWPITSVSVKWSLCVHSVEAVLHSLINQWTLFLLK